MRCFYFIGSFVLFFSTSVFAQEFQIKTPYYDVVDYDFNEIQVPGEDSSCINHFFHKWSELWALGAGKINILHIGGSHVQADMFSNQVRRNLDKINNNFQPSRGFVFPFNIAKTNNPTNYKVTYKGKWNAVRNVQKNREVSLGMGGVAVYTQDPDAEIKILLNPDELDRRWSFDELKLIGYNEDGMNFVRPILMLSDTTFLEPSYDMIDQYYHFSLPQLTDSFIVRFIQTDSLLHTFVLNGFLPEKDEEGIIYHAIGVNGASVSSYLDSENFEKELKLITPDLVIFGIGINDASGKNFSEISFIENYNQLIRIIKRVSPDCAFVFITNNDSYRQISLRNYRVNQNGPVARSAFYKLAKQHKGGLWDLFGIMGGLNSAPRWQRLGLLKADKIHFTQEGYVLIGDLFYNALMDYYEQNDIK